MRSRFHFPNSLNIFKSLHCLLFYFGEHCIFMRSCLHLPFYHVWLWWRKSYNSLYNPNIPWTKINPPPQQIFVYFHIPYPRTATNNNYQCSWLSKIHTSESSVHFPPNVLTGKSSIILNILRHPAFSMFWYNLYSSIWTPVLSTREIRTKINLNSLKDVSASNRAVRRLRSVLNPTTKYLELYHSNYTKPDTYTTELY